MPYKDPEKARECRRKYMKKYTKSPEGIKKRKEWQTANKDKVRGYAKKWNEKHPEKVKAWQEKRKERVKKALALYKAMYPSR